MDDRFGYFYVFIEPTQTSSDYPAKYLVSLPEEKDILFIIREPLFKIDNDVLDSYAERFRSCRACMYFEQNRNVWIIKNAASIYCIDTPTIEQVDQIKQSPLLSNVSHRSSEIEKGSIADSLSRIFTTLRQ